MTIRCDSKITSCPIEVPAEEPRTSHAPPAMSSSAEQQAPTERARASEGARLVQRQGAGESGSQGASAGTSPPGARAGVSEFASKACEVVVEVGARVALAKLAHMNGLKAEIIGKGLALAMCPSPTAETPAPPPPPPPRPNGAGGAPVQ